MNKELLEFSVSVYGQLESVNDVISKARCRIFYKHANRNGTYITDEFAEKLLSTLPYSPVKGIYEDDDFTDHGTERTQGRIYGIVPENPNIAWETHLDEDGVERTYACADVYIFTGLYKEAGEIVGKSQSMELFEPSIEYHFEIIHGQRYVVFDKGCFLGLQVLGEDVEPCFEGASFFSLQSSIEEIIHKIEDISSTYTKEGGKSEMDKLNFKISDSQKFDFLWSLLNAEYNEEGNWTITYSIMDVFDEYALAYNYESGNAERIYYSKNDESDSLEITSKEVVYIVDVTEKEKGTLDTLRELNGGNYELVSDTLANAADNAEKNSEFSAKIEELEANNATLETEKENSANLYQEAEEKIQNLETEVNELKDYKLGIETKEKEDIISQYEDKLEEAVLNTFREKMGEYSALELDKELTYSLKNSNPDAFFNSQKTDKVFEIEDTPASGLAGILSKYKK